MFLPKRIRKFIKLLRGQVSPVLAGLSVGLGFWFGLMPGFSGLHAFLLILLVLLNVPIGLFILFLGIGKGACLAGAPLLYELGLLVQAHLGALLSAISKIPIAGATDFRVIALAGAVVVGPVCGLILGLVFGKTILGFRKTWLKLEENSDKFNQWYNKKWVRILDRLVVGKRKAKDARSALEAKTKYLRKGGIIVAVLLIIIFLVLSFFMKNNYVRSQATARLTQANGATVDIAQLDIAPVSGRLAIEGLQVTDKDNLSQNKVQIGQVSTQASLYALTLGKLVMDEIVVSELQFDQPRDTPGQIAPTSEPGPTESEAFEPNEYSVSAQDLSKLQDYLENAQQIKDLLEKIRPWLPEKKETVTVPEKPEKYLDMLRAKSSTEAVMRLLAKKVILDKVMLSESLFGLSNIQLTNINDAPRAAALPIGLDIRSEQGPHMALQMHFDDPQTPGKITGTFADIDLTRLQSALKDSNKLVFESGQASGKIDGQLTSDAIDVGAAITLSQLKASSQGDGLFGLDAQTTNEVFQSLDTLDLSIRIIGPLSDPRLVLNTQALQSTIKDKLEEMGKQRAADEINKVIDKELGDKVPEEIKDVLDEDKIKKGLKDLLGGKKD